MEVTINKSEVVPYLGGFSGTFHKDEELMCNFMARRLV